MNTLEQDVIRRQQASPNSSDVEKGRVVRPNEGQPSLHSLILPAICALAGQLFGSHILTRNILK